MGVSLNYVTKESVTAQQLARLQIAVDEEASRFDWWCEGLRIFDEPWDGRAFGASKVFCNIEDFETDEFMAYWDLCELVASLGRVCQREPVEWRLSLTEYPFVGEVAASGPDAACAQSLQAFYDGCTGADPLKARSRRQVLARWRNR